MADQSSSSMADQCPLKFQWPIRLQPIKIQWPIVFQPPVQLPWSLILWKLCGFASGFGGIVAMGEQALKNHQFVVVVLTLFLILVLAYIWIPVGLSSADELRRMKDRLDGWEKAGWLKAFFFVLSVVGGVAVMYFDTKSSIADPLLFTGFSLSWFCLLRIVRPGTDYGVLGFLSTAVSVRAVKFWGFKHLLPYSFFSYSCVIGLLRIYLERRDTAA